MSIYTVYKRGDKGSHMYRTRSTMMMFVTRLIASLIAILGALHVVSGAIGGKEADPFDGGFVAVVYYNGRPAMMGTLVDRRWVLTLAYFVRPGLPYYVHIGNGEDGQGDVYYVDQSVIHPNFTGDFRDAFALLRLSRPARVGQPHINVIDAIASVEITETIKEKDRRCFYYSKGTTRADDGTYVIREELAKISTRFIRCKNVFTNLTDDASYTNQLSCTKSNLRGDIPCTDGGAPLMCRHQGQWYLTAVFGLLDTRNECHSSETAGFEVAIHMPWIKSIIDA